MKQYLMGALAATGVVLGGASLAEAATINNATYMYRGPSYGSGTILPLPAGAKVGVGECPGEWCSASYGGKTGWIHKSFLYGGGGGALQTTGGTTMGTQITIGSHRRSRFSPLGMALSSGGHRRGGGNNNNNNNNNNGGGDTFYGRHVGD